MSSEGRRRLVWNGFKTVLVAGVFAGLAWGGYEITAALRGQPKRFSGAAPAVPVNEIVLMTDGVLDQKWLVQTLALPKKATLMELDLYKLRAALLAHAQVRSATLTRNFPATLTVSLSELSPVARIMAQLNGESPRMFLVAREGIVFEGTGFDPEMIGTLPWLDGVKLTRKNDEFVPIAGMDKVADLLAKAKMEAEHLYRTWEVVSLARLESDGEIEVRDRDVAKIFFGTNEDFFRQLARLDLLLDKTRAETAQSPREINLSIGSQVPVSFGDPALMPGATKSSGGFPAGNITSFSPTHSQETRKTKL
jgi:cell division protein FtsQ